jgi:nucleotide-binding universal stress UspA family protein
VDNPTDLTPRNVLVPLDGSELAARAIDVGVEIADAVPAPLELVTVGPWEGVEIDERRYLTDVAAALSDTDGDGDGDGDGDDPEGPETVRTIRLDVLHHHDPAAALSAAVSRMPSTLTVMATHGRSGVRRAALGSVAEAIVANSGAPVVLHGPGLLGPTHVRGGVAVIGLDGSDHAERALDHLQPLAAALELRVHVVWVRESELLNGLDRPAERVEQGVARLAEAGVAAEVVVLDHAHPAKALASHAFDHAAVLCAASTHGRSGLARTVLGSVAMRLVNESPCPVLVVRPGAPRSLV